MSNGIVLGISFIIDGFFITFALTALRCALDLKMMTRT